MKTNIVQIGNSKGVRIPKALLEQLKFERTVEFEITSEGLLMRPVKEKKTENPRADWAEMFDKALANEADDAREFDDWNVANLSEFDEKEW